MTGIGAFTYTAFIFKHKREIGLLFPVFRTYDTDNSQLKPDNDGNLCLHRYGESLVFITFAPIMAADGSFEKKLMRQK